MKRISVRLLLICAAISLAGGIVFAANAYLGAVIVVATPLLYGVVLGVYFLPGAIAQAVLHRPFVAVVTAVAAALVSCPVQPSIPRALSGALLIGALQEAVFALGGYRYWRTWVFVVSSALAGLVLGVILFFALHFDAAPAWVQIVQLAVSVAAPVAATLTGLGVAAAVQRMGAARGLARA